MASSGSIDSVNVGTAEPNPWKRAPTTGIDKRPHPGPVAVRVPGPGGSGLAGDHVGDVGSHGGPEQAVYAYAREDLDTWEQELGRPIPNGLFGENLTTRGLDVNGALLGERWRIGESLELVVRGARVPCSTFRGRLGLPGWLKTFTAAARPGAYLEVLSPGSVSPGDEVQVVHRPTHDVTVTLLFRALMTDRRLLPQVWTAGADLTDRMTDWLRSIDPAADAR